MLVMKQDPEAQSTPTAVDIEMQPSIERPAECDMHNPSQRDAEHIVTAADPQSSAKAESGAGQEDMKMEEAPTPDDGQQLERYIRWQECELRLITPANDRIR